MNSLDSRSSYGALDVGLYLLGVAGLTASLTLLFLGMRAVMDVGGFCAEGGPYVIETHCPEGVGVLMPLSIFGGMGSLALILWKGALIGRKYVALAFLAWPALFISLGWNFLEYAIWPPGPEGGIVWGWLIPGVMFVIMGAVPLLAMLPSRRMASASPDSPAELVTARKRLLNDLVQSAHDRGWGGEGDVVSKLERLAALRRAGVIDETEFERAKRAVLDEAQR